MATWTSLVVLSLAVVSTLSFPRPGAEYKIPTVGLGSRAQYYVLHSDGGFKYGYDSGDGIYEQSMALIPGEVSGAFGYKDPTGADIKLEYTADDRGFLPRGGHLPVAPEGDFGARVRAASDVRGAARSPGDAFTAAAYSGAVSAGPVEVAQVRSTATADGGYDFAYETSSHSRSESGDAQNSVRGQFAFTADDGVNRGITYRAGAQLGFIAEGDHLPVGPSVPGAESGIPTGNIFPVLSEEEANALAASTSYGARTQASSGSAAGSSGAIIVKSAPTGSSDASYSFSYDADESSRSETADADLNVKGTYSFLPPEGHRLTVNYVAGSETGFVATGDHLPVVPEAGSDVQVKAGTGTAGAIAYSAPARVSPSRTAPASPSAAPVEVAQVRSSFTNGGYSFGYETSSSSRSESADASNSVKGSYSFVADDGINRGITYIAGSGTGFIAEGDSLPVGPSVPGAESGIPTGRIFPILSEEEANELAAATYGTASATAYAAPSDSHSEVASSRSDASYSFSYDAGDSAREESADANLNVKGSYSFEPPEGDRLTVNYIAGSDTGFVATGAHLPVASETGAVPYSAAPARASPAAASPSAGSAGVSAPSPSVPARVRSSADRADASYSFSYDAGDSARQESADANLNVQGSYSFSPPEGDRLTVNYIAGSGTGFVATGDHLPVASETGAVPYSADPAPGSPAAASPSAGSAGVAAPSPSVPARVRSSADRADASYSFSYDAGDSARSESADADLNIKGHYSFVPPQGQRLTVNYEAGSGIGFVATGDHIPGSDSYSPAAIVYSAPAASDTASVNIPSEVAQVRSSQDIDGRYSFSYENSDSSRTESADSQNSVTGHFTFVADDGVNRKITYVAGSDTGFIAEGDGLPAGPSVPGAESGIPTGRILPVFSEEEANARARASLTGAPSPLLKTGAAGDAAAAPADASYSFAFESDTYSRNEEADADGNIVGGYTYVDEEGKEHSVTFVAGRETGFLPEGFPTPKLDSASVGAPTGSDRGGAPATAYSSKRVTSRGRVATKSAPETPSQQPALSSGTGHSSRVVGDVLLHQYDSVNSDKYGYVFTAVRR